MCIRKGAPGLRPGPRVQERGSSRNALGDVASDMWAIPRGAGAGATGLKSVVSPESQMSLSGSGSAVPGNDNPSV